jgi:hypothetical protein
MAEDVVDSDVPRDEPVEAPLTLFESAILETKRGILPVDELARAYWGTELAIPSMEPATASIRDMAPAMFEVDDFPVVAVFSHESRAAEFAKEFGTPYLLLATGRQLATVMNPEVGVIINPRSSRFAAVLPPEALAAAKRTFGE